MKAENCIDRIIQVNDISIGKSIAQLSIYSYNRIEKDTCELISKAL